MNGLPDVAAPERQSLEQFLDFHRTQVLRTLEELRDLYEDACTASRRVAGRIESLDALAVRASFGGQRVSLRWIYLHMIEETAQHRGHLDLLLDAIRQARETRSR